MVKPLEAKTDNTILASTDENTSKKKSVSYWGEKHSSTRTVFGANPNSIDAKSMNDSLYSKKRTYKFSMNFISKNRLSHPEDIKPHSVVPILLNYKTLLEKTSQTLLFSQRVCADSILNESIREDFNHVLNCLDSKAKELGVSTLEYHSACERAINKTFEGIMAWFGVLDDNNLQKIDNAFFEYAEAIKRAEIRNSQKNDNVDKALTSEDIEQKINEAFERNPWLMEDTKNYTVNNDLIEKHNLNKDDLFGDGKFNSPALQLTGNCVLHATINAMKQSKKGLEILETLHEKRGSGIAIFLPEAYNNKVGRNGSGVYIYDKGTLTTSINELSIGDGDISAFAAAEYDYNVHMTKKDAIDKDSHRLYRGFEILSGKRAKFYDASDNIPTGVGYTYSNDFIFDKLRDLVKSGKGACTVAFHSNVKNYNYTVDSINSNKVSETQAMISSGHAYSVVKFVGNNVYLQESNTPTKYIKLSREMFLKMTDKIATWKF